MGTLHSSPLRLAVLISGGGTTLRNLIAKIDAGALPAEICLVVSSNSDARGLKYAEAAGIPAVVAEKRSFATPDAYSEAVFAPCREQRVDLVVMAGFLKLVPIPGDYRERVLNIHPALIPAYSGAGYYGNRVHAAVLAAGEKYSGCTVHFVDDHYDHGPIVLQRHVPVLPGDTAETLQVRVFEAECEAYPEAIRLFAEGRIRIEGEQVVIAPNAAG
jgi:phosphoribosylglycinamide formyltransferase-1